MLVMSELPSQLFRPVALSEALVRLRTEAHLSQRALASLAGVPLLRRYDLRVARLAFLPLCGLLDLIRTVSDGRRPAQ